MQSKFLIAVAMTYHKEHMLQEPRILLVEEEEMIEFYLVYYLRLDIWLKLIKGSGCVSELEKMKSKQTENCEKKYEKQCKLYIYFNYYSFTTGTPVMTTKVPIDPINRTVCS